MSSGSSQRRWTLSSIKTRESNFHWKISGFSELKIEEFLKSDSQSGPRQRLIESPSFSVNSHGLKWCLVMFCRKDEHCGPNLYFEFRSKDFRFFKIDVTMFLSILNQDEERLHKKSYSFYVEHSMKRAYSGFLNNFLSLSDLFDERYGFIENDELNILCEYRLVPKHKRGKLTENYDLKSRLEILDSFERQWEKQEDGDLLLAAPCNRVVLTHRFVLKSRCPMFYEALKADLKDTRTGLVKIEELRYDVLEKMLRFMYSGKIKNLDHESVCGLLEAARKYDIGDLKDHCKEFLLKNLGVGNATRTLELCNRYDLEDIQPLVETFVKANNKSIQHGKTIKRLDSSLKRDPQIHREHS